MNDSLEDSQERFTGGLYGFLIMLAARIREHKPKAVVICMDSKPYHRQKAYGEYKGDRSDTVKKDKDGVERVPTSILVKQSVPLCLELLEILKIPVAAKEGYEADDMIAFLSDEYYHEFDEILIESNDSDLYQLLDEEKKVACIRKKGLYNYDDFQKEWDGISQTQLVAALAMMGTHNAVTGIKGIGQKTAIKTVKSSKLMQQVKDRHEGLIERNESLIVLPWPGLEEYELPHLLVPDYNDRKLLKFLSTYDIKLTDRVSEAFEWLGETVHDLI